METEIENKEAAADCEPRLSDEQFLLNLFTDIQSGLAFRDFSPHEL